MYKYITTNNLENKQNYMYSEYKGKDFLKAYRDIRQKFCMKIFNVESEIHVSKDELKKLFEKLGLL